MKGERRKGKGGIWNGKGKEKGEGEGEGEGKGKRGYSERHRIGIRTSPAAQKTFKLGFNRICVKLVKLESSSTHFPGRGRGIVRSKKPNSK